MNWLSRLIRLPLRLMPPNRAVRIVSGELRGWKWISGSATHGCWLGHYEREAQEIFVAAIRPGDVVYDVGANVGFYTLLASKLAGHGSVVSFEPLPRNLALLERHLRLNAVRNVRVLPIAVSSRSGTARFATSHNPAMGGLTATGEIEVTTASLDDLIAARAIARPSFMKIDVEGAEHDVLTGAAKLLAEDRPTILLSAHGYLQHDRCLTLLRAAGYDVRVLRDGAADGNYVDLVSHPSRR